MSRAIATPADRAPRGTNVYHRARDALEAASLEVQALAPRPRRPSWRRRRTPGRRNASPARGRASPLVHLDQLGGLVTPDTILRWYRELIANKYEGTARQGGGRSGTAASLQRRVVQFATENPGGAATATPASSDSPRSRPTPPTWGFATHHNSNPAVSRACSVVRSSMVIIQDACPRVSPLGIRMPRRLRRLICFSVGSLARQPASMVKSRTQLER